MLDSLLFLELRQFLLHGSLFVGGVVHETTGELVDLVEDGLRPWESLVFIEAFEGFGLGAFLDGVVHGLDFLFVVGDVLVGELPCVRRVLLKNSL